MRTWRVDPSHTHVEFAVSHMVIGQVKGIFRQFEGTLKVPGLDFEKAQLTAQIEVRSIFTNSTTRDEHLCSADFFNVDNFPYIKFTSTRFIEKENRKHDIEGYLSIKNISLPFTLHAQYKGMQLDPWGNDRLGFLAEGKLNRILWGLKWNNLLQNGAFVIGHEVYLYIACELVSEEAYHHMFSTYKTEAIG